MDLNETHDDGMSDLANNQEINQEIGELEIDVGTEHKNNDNKDEVKKEDEVKKSPEKPDAYENGQTLEEMKTEYNE